MSCEISTSICIILYLTAHNLKLIILGQTNIQVSRQIWESPWLKYHKLNSCNENPLKQTLAQLTYFFKPKKCNQVTNSNGIKNKVKAYLPFLAAANEATTSAERT